MKRIFINQLAAVAIIVLLFNAQPTGASSTPKQGDTLPAINLNVPKDPVLKSEALVLPQRGFVLFYVLKYLKLQITNIKYQTISNDRNSKFL